MRTLLALAEGVPVNVVGFGGTVILALVGAVWAMLRGEIKELKHDVKELSARIDQLLTALHVVDKEVALVAAKTEDTGRHESAVVLAAVRKRVPSQRELPVVTVAHVEPDEGHG